MGLLGLDDKIQQEYIAALFKFPVKEENVKQHASSLRKLKLVREAQNIAREVYAQLNNFTGSESISEIIDCIEKPVFGLSSTIQTASDDKTELFYNDILAYIENVVHNPTESVGIPSPWTHYNDAIGGGRRRGGVYLISSRMKVGKSSLCLNDAIFCSYKLNIPTLYLDSEMSKIDGHSKTLAKLANIPILNIEKGKLRELEVDRLIQVGKSIQNIPLYYRKISGKSFSEIISIIRNFIMQHVGMTNGTTNDCIIMYDYFKLMDVTALKSLQEYQALGFQIQELTDFCQKYSVTCSAYAQLNREEEVAMSDRIGWLVSSIAKLKVKTSEEINLDGIQYGNRKLIMCEQRYGPGLDGGDYINLMIERDRCNVHELGLKSDIPQNDHDHDDGTGTF